MSYSYEDELRELFEYDWGKEAFKQGRKREAPTFYRRKGKLAYTLGWDHARDESLAGKTPPKAPASS